jgi:predicted methyltransferase
VRLASSRVCAARRAVVAAALVLGGPPGQAQDPAARRPAPVMGASGAGWLEREGRDAEQRPDDVIRVMKLAPGAVVADVGCGTGYFARRLARAVGARGRVYAVDVQPEMLDRLRERLAREAIDNVTPVLGEADDPRLAPASVDAILLVDVYHELQQPRAMLARMRAALRSGGRITLVEYRLEGPSALHIRPEHRMSVEQILAEWQPAGFRLVERHDFLPTQHLLVFEAASS